MAAPPAMAYKYLPPNGLNLEIKFTISDDGPGLPIKKRKEVFARGFRLDEQTHGTGLGLNVVKDTGN